MDGDELDTSTSFTQLGLPLSFNLTWKTHIHSLAKHVSQKVSFLARAHGFFSSSHLLSTYKSQTCPSLEYCYHVCGGAPKSSLCLLEPIPDTFTGIAPRRSGILFQFLWSVSEPQEAQLIHTLSKFHCICHKLYLTNHHSSLEHAIDETSCLLLASLNLTNLPSFKSKINRLDLISLSS